MMKSSLRRGLLILALVLGFCLASGWLIAPQPDGYDTPIQMIAPADAAADWFNPPALAAILGAGPVLERIAGRFCGRRRTVFRIRRSPPTILHQRCGVHCRRWRKG